MRLKYVLSRGGRGRLVGKERAVDILIPGPSPSLGQERGDGENRAPRRTNNTGDGSRGERPRPTGGLGSCAGFTMLEIALCLAIIGFALVAIIGILPTGMQVQKDNREDTIINQDAGYWMEAIRNGQQDLGTLLDYVDEVSINDVVPTAAKPFTNGWQIIGLMSTPGTTNYAYVRAISGPAAEKGNNADMKDFAFKYRLRVDVLPFVTGGFRDSADLPSISTNLYEVRLRFAWPVLGDPADPSKLRIGNNRQTVRTLVAGSMSTVTNGSVVYHFLGQQP